jgi:hypothetical protein
LPPIIRMPAEHTLPAGPRRQFVEELHDHYRAARRPTLRVVSDRIKQREDLAGMPSRETIRRMLSGATVPARWEIVNAVFLVLCEMADRDPNGCSDDNYGDAPTYAQSLELAWNEALDDQPLDHPYGNDPPLERAYDDEPPF